MSNPAELADLHAKSRITVHNNIFGFALHSRVLDAITVNGFVMAHHTPWTGLAGQMTECFEPETHYGEYTAANFTDRARYWLNNHAARNKAATEARKIVADRHLWPHRAQQILRDLV